MCRVLAKPQAIAHLLREANAGLALGRDAFGLINPQATCATAVTGAIEITGALCFCIAFALWIQASGCWRTGARAIAHLTQGTLNVRIAAGFGVVRAFAQSITADAVAAIEGNRWVLAGSATVAGTAACAGSVALVVRIEAAGNIQALPRCDVTSVAQSRTGTAAAITIDTEGTLALVITVTLGAGFFSWDALTGGRIAIGVGIALGRIHTRGPTLCVIACVGITTVCAAINATTRSITLVDCVNIPIDTGLRLTDRFAGIQLACAAPVTVAVGGAG